MSPARTCLVLVVGAALVVGCSAEPGRPAGQQPPTTTQSGPPATIAPPAAPPAAPGGATDQDAELPAPEAVPTWDAPSRLSAVGQARTALAAFARPQLPRATWWSLLAPLLTPTAQAAYQGTDPAQVPVRAVTGPGRLVDETSAYLARVELPTDVGPYLVLLVRDGQGAPWLVERLTPPAGLR